MQSIRNQIIFNLLFGVIFTYLAIRPVTENGWTFYPIMLICFAAIDYIRAVNLLMFLQKNKKDIKK
ncbi:YdiK family protein [Brochothrix campestris]|uniref:YdiK family protein n=1 Tax=Brochothrix campestris TaxID=2757 RepID=UPI0038D22F45